MLHLKHIFGKCLSWVSMRVHISRASRASSRASSSLCFLGGAISVILFVVAVKDLTSFRFGTKRVRANQVYQEYISDKHHLHMNSTRWVTLTEFVKHLGRSGIARVDETEKGWFIAWIDSSPKALAKAVRD
jgi:Domain of Kin17 curved DNA-binding protein